MELQQDLAQMSLPTQPQDGPWPITISTRTSSEKSPKMTGQGLSIAHIFRVYLGPDACNSFLDTGTWRSPGLKGRKDKAQGKRSAALGKRPSLIHQAL
jgi:hypothetical protein